MTPPPTPEPRLSDAVAASEGPPPAEKAAPAKRGSAPSARLRVQRVRPAYRQVADELRSQIMRGALGPGERLPSEAELSRAFGVSRSTVREALRALTSQHLIETLRGVQGGSFVAAPDPTRVVEDVGSALGVLVATPYLQLEDLLEARLLLEPAAARLAAQRADAETVDAVRAAANAPRDPQDPSGFVPHLDFHTTVLMATGNLMFTMMGQPVSDVLRTQLDRDTVARREWDEVDECHRVIAEHIAAGEAEAAEDTMRSHLLDLRGLYERAASWRTARTEARVRARDGENGDRT
ncbi:MAG: GntR family transcriptional regulator [Pseudonocardia sp.]|nr:GntR family transcriptional regulator [Pseudonocardia sp.]